MKNITVVTGNPNKAKEIEALIGAPVESASLDIKEIQSLSIGEVAREKALVAYQALGVPVIVDDTGMNIAALEACQAPWCFGSWKALGQRAYCV